MYIHLHELKPIHMHTSKHKYSIHNSGTHNTIKHTSQLLHFYPHTYTCTYLGATCGAPTEALAEATEAAEDVNG